MIVAGRHERPDGFGEAAGELAQRAGWPLLADPLSGARRGTAAIAHYDALLRDPHLAGRLRPDFVLRVGDLPVSKPLREWLAGMADVPQIAIDPEGAWQDPASVLWESMALEPVDVLRALIADGETTAAEDWLSQWRSADERAAEAIGAVLSDSGLSEPRLAVELGMLLPSEATLFVASSMPVRDIETFWPVSHGPAAGALQPRRERHRRDRLERLRGGGSRHRAGAPADRRRRPGTRHRRPAGGRAPGPEADDRPARERRRRDLRLPPRRAVAHGPPARGRGRDDEHPSQGAGDIFTRHVTTPTGLDFARAGALYGLAHERAGDLPSLRDALERALASEHSAIIEVRTDRSENVALHRRVWDAVAVALSSPGGAAGPPA